MIALPGLFFAVDLIGRFEHRRHGYPLLALQLLEKAALPASVTGDAAQLFDLRQDNVIVAVQAQILHELRVS
jgi:phosphoheptose isomerase